MTQKRARHHGTDFNRVMDCFKSLKAREQDVTHMSTDLGLIIEGLDHHREPPLQSITKSEPLKLTDFVTVRTLQELQDSFSVLSGVPSCILDPEGVSITEASSLPPFCQLVRSSPKGVRSCEMSSNRILGITSKKPSVGLPTCPVERIAATSIPVVVQGRNVAMWWLGQVMERQVDTSAVREYARAIGMDEGEAVRSSERFTPVPEERFTTSSTLARIIAGQLSLRCSHQLFQISMIIERMELKAVLKKSEEDFRFLASKFLSTQEEDKKRIARDLHDGLGGSLSAIKISLEALKKQIEEGTASSELLELPISWTQNVLDETRRLTGLLRPSLLDELGLIPAIARFLRQYRATYPEINVEEDIQVREQDIPEHLKIVVFRITQEAFHNIAKYSKADFAVFSLVNGEGSLRLVIEDNGAGFDIEAVLARTSKERGLGLTSMKERAELSGGLLVLRSALGEGTTVQVGWPL